MSASGPSASDPQRVGRYSVLRRIGRGGMSTVFDAYDPELDRRVALKLVTAWESDDSQGPARLVREARAMAKISHPNVVPVYDAGVVDDAVFIAMELIDGPTLEAWAKRTARPWTEILRMYLLAGRGLAAAHDAGLVHRDFKPDNVMVGPDDRPRVLDFGLARPTALDHEDLLLPADDDDHGDGDGDLFGDDELDQRIDEYERDLAEPHEHGADTLVGLPRYPTRRGSSFDLVVDVTRQGVVTGTPAYMAPEQHLGEAGGPASDQFAFCVSLWEALYRQRPFAGKSYFAIADAIIEGRREPPPSNTHVPGWIRNLLERGLAVDAKHRHPSMRSLLASFVFTFKVMHGIG